MTDNEKRKILLENRLKRLEKLINEDTEVQQKSQKNESLVQRYRQLKNK